MCSLIVCSISLYCYVRIKRVYIYIYIVYINVEVHGAPIIRPATSLPHLLLYGIPLRRFTLHAFCFLIFDESILCLTLFFLGVYR